MSNYGRCHLSHVMKPMKNIINIVGTGTGIGKTYTCCRLIEYLIAEGKVAYAIKPIASGIISTEYGLINEDSYKLYMANQQHCNFKQITPFLLNTPIAPHIAAYLEHATLEAKQIATTTQDIVSTLNCDFVLIEGIGGVMVPLNNKETYIDILTQLAYPLILVISIQLGCLNHGLLTAMCLEYNHLKCVGWIANFIEPDMPLATANVEFLKDKLNMPLLATITYKQKLHPTKHFASIFLNQ